MRQLDAPRHNLGQSPSTYTYIYILFIYIYLFILFIYIIYYILCIIYIYICVCACFHIHVHVDCLYNLIFSDSANSPPFFLNSLLNHGTRPMMPTLMAVAAKKLARKETLEMSTAVANMLPGQNKSEQWPESDGTSGNKL